MSLKDIGIKWLFNSYEDDIIEDFYRPIIRESNSYKRSTGYFSTSFINKFYEEIKNVNDEKELYIQILCSPNMTQSEVKEIQLGYKMKDFIQNQINSVISEFSEDDNTLPDISKLIAKGFLDIKFVIPKNQYGLFHEKKGIFTDETGYKIAFIGSNNETLSAMNTNYETFTTFNSDELIERVEAIEKDFDQIWLGNKESLETYEVTDIINDSIVEKYGPIDISMASEKVSYPKISSKYTLHEYQQEAVDSWLSNNGVGLLEMATGTGKTITALSCYEHICKKVDKLLTIIVVPQVDLIHQWAEDIEATGANVIKCYSENYNWNTELRIRLKSLENTEGMYLTVLVTRDTFLSEKFQKRISKNTTDRLLISDEVHSFGTNNIQKIYQEISNNFKYRLGISATPFRKSNSETEKLINLFGKVVFHYSLKKAIQNGYLNKYNYLPKILFFDNEELSKYRKIYSENREAIHVEEKFAINKIDRVTSTIMNSSTAKVHNLLEDIEGQSNKAFQAIIYCSPGGYNDTQQKFDDRHIELVSRGLGQLPNIDLKIVTSGVKNKDREIALEQFKEKKINTLVAIKCLDQGINLKGVTEAYILSSTDSETEFIQRRGRILRKEANKPISKIIDYVMFPQDFRNGDIIPHESEGYVVSRELRRMKSYAIGAENESVILDIISSIEKIYYNELLEEKDYEFVSKQ